VGIVELTMNEMEAKKDKTMRTHIFVALLFLPLVVVSQTNLGLQEPSKPEVSEQTEQLSAKVPNGWGAANLGMSPTELLDAFQGITSTKLKLPKKFDRDKHRPGKSSWEWSGLPCQGYQFSRSVLMKSECFVLIPYPCRAQFTINDVENRLVEVQVGFFHEHGQSTSLKCLRQGLYPPDESRYEFFDDMKGQLVKRWDAEPYYNGDLIAEWRFGKTFVRWSVSTFVPWSPNMSRNSYNPSHVTGSLAFSTDPSWTPGATAPGPKQ